MLNDVKARPAKPRYKDYKLADSGGFYLGPSKASAKVTPDLIA
jgi:hypothetical protein